MKTRYLIKSLVCLLLTIIAGLRVSAQVLTNDQLINNAYTAYAAGDYETSSIYLYAYIQRNPDEFYSQPDVATSVKASCAYSFSRLSGMLNASLAINIDATLLSANELISNSNQAIQTNNWSQGAIYTFAYMQKMGASGYNIYDLSNSYADLKSNLDQALNDFSNLPPPDSGNRVIDHAHRTRPLLMLPAPSLQGKGQMKKPTAEIHFKDFSDAFQFVFSESANGFQNILGPPFSNNNTIVQNFKPLINIENGSVVPSNIFNKNNSRGFRFVISGEAAGEANQFDELCGDIERVFMIERLKYSKTPYQYRSGTPSSFAYFVHGRRIEITRTILGNEFSDEVIIYKLQ